MSVRRGAGEGHGGRGGARARELADRLERVAGALRSLRLADDVARPLLVELERCRALIAEVGSAEGSVVTVDDDGWMSPANDVGDPRLARALDALRRRLGARWTVAALARIAGMSRAAFARLFAETMGAPPLRHLTTMRMHEAARLLAQTDEGLAALAGRLGYASEFAFSRAFKRHVGVAPAVHRRASRQERATGTTRPTARRSRGVAPDARAAA